MTTTTTTPSGAPTSAKPAPPAPAPAGPLPAGPPPAAEPPPDGAPRTLNSVVELAGVAIAGTTFITALAFYFGWTMTNAFGADFGIDGSAFGYSTQEYVLRSADALFIPLGVIALLALAALTLHAGMRRWLASSARRRLLVALAGAGAGVGALLLAVGVWAVKAPPPVQLGQYFERASPGLGIVLLAYGVHILRQAGGGRSADSQRLPALVVTFVCLIVTLSAFLTSATFARAMGHAAAVKRAVNLDRRPSVTVYSPKDLHIAGPGVVVKRLRSPGSAFRYRYGGLRLLVRAGGKYFLLPDRWTFNRGRAILLVDDPSLRFEFERGRAIARSR